MTNHSIRHIWIKDREHAWFTELEEMTQVKFLTQKVSKLGMLPIHHSLNLLRSLLIKAINQERDKDPTLKRLETEIQEIRS